MRLRSLPYLTLPLSMAVLVACSATSSDEEPISGEESHYTSEAGADASADDAASPAEVAPFTLADVSGDALKLRFSVDGAAAVDAHQPKQTVLASGDRRFELEGATPVSGGKPYFYVELGRGAAFIEQGAYDCARLEAIALIVDTDGKKKMSLVDGAAPRACQVVVDAVEEMDVSSLPSTTRPRSMRKVVGHVDAIVGAREDAASDTKTVRATFATIITEPRVL